MPREQLPSTTAQKEPEEKEQEAGGDVALVVVGT